MVEALLSRLRRYCPRCSSTARPYASRTAEGKAVKQNPANHDEYVRQALDAYRTTPGTMGIVRRARRLLAA